MSAHRIYPLAAWLVFGCGAAIAQNITLEALVDRTTLRENESFTYTLRVEGSVRGDPVVPDLADDFDVLNRSTNSRIQIVNGQTRQVAEWQYQLMPRRAGTFVIPPAQIAGTMSNSVEIEVLAGPPPGDDLADIFMEVEASPSSAYVQSQIVFTLRLFVGIGTGRATLTTPEVNGVEAIVERLGEDANYSTVRGTRNF
ncbi:MAG TPA: BatD family protein, partial [Gammaproteobacteria bacterium]|nr:BatD family protein [Gammaproteobacteria bacterium]